MNDHLKSKMLDLCVPTLRNSQLLRARNINLGTLTLNQNTIKSADLNLAHPELIVAPARINDIKATRLHRVNRCAGLLPELAG